MFVSDPLGQLAADVAELAAEDGDGWSEAARSERLIGIVEQIERLRAEALRCGAEWDGAKAWAFDAAPSAPSWLVANCAMTRCDAVRCGAVRPHRPAPPWPRVHREGPRRR